MRQEQAPFDAHYAAGWSKVTSLSEKSISKEDEPQGFPVFTRIRWMIRKPVFTLDYIF